MDPQKPRLTRFLDLQDLVAELREKGLDDINLYQRLTEIGIIDLDVLGEVMKQSDDDPDQQISA